MTLVPSGLPWNDFDAPPAEDRSAPAIGLLPPRAAVLDRLAETMPSAATHPATLLVVGLRRRDDGWPIPPEALDQLMALMARELRADDWVALAGPTEFAVLVPSAVQAAQAVAGRLLTGINAAAVRDMTAAAGVAVLEPGLSASEVLRRATLCLATARTMGAGQVITYSGTR
jgi:GGDEF domain-containing protein